MRNEQPMDKRDLKTRTQKFGFRVIRLVESLTKGNNYNYCFIN